MKMSPISLQQLNLEHFIPASSPASEKNEGGVKKNREIDIEPGTT